MKRHCSWIAGLFDAAGEALMLGNYLNHYCSKIISTLFWNTVKGKLLIKGRIHLISKKWTGPIYLTPL